MPKRVFVGLSGGVDSSVAAARLLRAGYDVTGVFIKVWHPDWLVCNWEEERLDAMRVAAHLGIPFLTCDGVAAYRDEVAKEFIGGYERGETPNPDVLCNKSVKFGAFLDFARAHGADFVATGHYAAKLDETTLGRGLDSNKDQSYFLWMLSHEQLQYSLFPLGESTKDEIRAEAAALNLPTASKKDSQGVCFLGHIDIKEFLSHYVTLTPGQVLDTAGQVIGTHDSALLYTIGQRHGFTITKGGPERTPHYVVDRDIAQNTITVANIPKVTPSGIAIKLRNVVWREPSLLLPNTTVMAQVRYRQTPEGYRVLSHTNETLILEPMSQAAAASSGQSCVLYDGRKCLGGGIITR